MGCTYLTFVGETGLLIQGFSIRGDSMYVNTEGPGDSPDVIQVFDKVTGSLKYQVSGRGGTLQQTAATDTHLGWTEYVDGVTTLYGSPLGSTEASVFHTMMGIKDVSGLSSGWLVPQDGTPTAQLALVRADGGEAQVLALEGAGIDEHPVLERDGILYFRTGELLDPHSLWSTPLAGGEPTLIAQLESIDTFFVDATDMYIIENDTSGAGSRYLNRVPLSGGVPERISESLASSTIFDLVGYGEYLYITDSERIALTDGSPGWVARLYQIEKSSGNITVSAVSDHGMFDLYADATGIYFTHETGSGHAILRFQ